MPLNVAGADAKPAVALPRDLFADALAEDSEEAGQSTAPAEQADQLANGQRPTTDSSRRHPIRRRTMTSVRR